MPSPRRNRSPFLSTGLSFVIIIGSLLMFLLIPKELLPSEVHKILITLLAISFIHLIDTLVFRREMLRFIKRLLRRQTDIYVKETQKTLRKDFDLLNHADEAGLVAIYPTRDAAIQDATQALESATERVWMLGIAFTLKLAITDDLLRKFCAKKMAGGFDLKIILLDALRSPSVFRTFLESSEQSVRRILHNDPTDPGAESRYFDQHLYQDYSHTFATLSSEFHCDLWPCVRYYAHAPSIWMLILDDEIFIEPYTFGRPPDLKEARIGGGLPVFRFRRTDGKGTYDILVDHYKKLWLTSDIDLFQVEARRHDRAWVLKRILNRGRGWFKNAYGVLYYANRAEGKEPMMDRRLYPRYVVPDQFLLTVRGGPWPNQPGAESTFAVLRDISRCGARLDLIKEDVPKVGEFMGLEQCQSGPDEVKHMVDRLWSDSKDRELRVVGVRGKSVRLQSVPQ